MSTLSAPVDPCVYAPLRENTRVAAISIVPVLVREVAGDTVRLPPATLIVPLLVCAADALPMVTTRLTVSVPWLSIWALSVRGPPPPARTSMLPPTALTRVPELTFSVAERKETSPNSSIAPSLVKPFATVSVA